MNIILNIDDINPNSISFYNPIKNKFKKYEKFYKIVYNCNNFTINTLIISIPLQETFYIDNEKKILSFSHKIKDRLKILETETLKKITCSNKKYRLILDLSYNNLISKININCITLRIYGIWNNDLDVGLVYRFIY